MFKQLKRDSTYCVWTCGGRSEINEFVLGRQISDQQEKEHCIVSQIIRQRWNRLPPSSLPFTGGIQVQAGQPQPGKKQPTSQRGLECNMDYWTGESMIQPFWTNPAITEGLIWAPKSTRSLTAVRNYSLKGEKTDRKLIFQLFSMGSQPKGQEAVRDSSVQWPEREKYHCFIMQPFFQLSEIILMFPRTLPRPCGDYRVK